VLNGNHALDLIPIGLFLVIDDPLLIVADS